jgi:hypothetical protein
MAHSSACILLRPAKFLHITKLCSLTPLTPWVNNPTTAVVKHLQKIYFSHKRILGDDQIFMTVYLSFTWGTTGDRLQAWECALFSELDRQRERVGQSSLLRFYQVHIEETVIACACDVDGTPDATQLATPCVCCG